MGIHVYWYILYNFLKFDIIKAFLRLILIPRT